MKILTALQDPKTNEILKEKTKHNIIETDIQYQEGILETLEKNNKIDLIIISQLLPGNIGFKDLINKIKIINNNIEIIAILENKNNELKDFLKQKNINSIFYNNEITIDELINVIEEKDKNKKEMEINKEIKLLKEIILENNKKIEQNKKEKKINKILSILKEEKIKIIKNSKINNIKKFKNKTNKTQNKIISVVGIPGVGKSIFISLFSKNIKHKKILIIDFDIYNKSLDLIFGYNTKVQQEKAIIKINNNIDLLSKIEIFFKESYIEKNKIKNILDSFSKKYDLIIIDNTSEYSCEHTKEILKNSDSIIFLSDANLIELNKTKKLLEKYINKWKIEKERINVVFNKININSINNKILNNLFSDFNILGKINFSNKYNLIINNNLKILNKKINKEYINIIKKMKIN
ncbi:unknown [Clostridium sp. CAG:452]|nr:unknown [Clostridium sp. CAG:452]